MVGLEIITPAGSGIIEKIYISELNYLMIKIKLDFGTMGQICKSALFGLGVVYFGFI